MQQINGTKSMTGMGLDFLLEHQFTEATGSRIRQGVPQIGVVITGRRSADRVEEKAKELKNKGVTLYVIGRRDAAVEVMREIVSKPENMYFVSNFSNLHYIIGDIIQSLCATAEEGRNLNVQLTPGLYNAENQLTIQRWWTLTIQCHYGEEYRDHVKYWCRMRTQSSCTTIVSTDAAERRGQVSIADDPAHHVFHITMRDLQMMDTDVYWCGVKTNNTELYMAPLNLTVTAGGNVSIQSFYSEGNREQEKRWCRRGSSCVTAEGSKTSQDRVHLDVDDRRCIFTVTVTRLESNDTGWYWITAGDQHLPVHISVVPENIKNNPFPSGSGTVPLKLTLRQPPSQRWKVVHMVLQATTVLVYLICSVVAATVIRSPSPLTATKIVGRGLCQRNSTWVGLKLRTLGEVNDSCDHIPTVTVHQTQEKKLQWQLVNDLLKKTNTSAVNNNKKQPCGRLWLCSSSLHVFL
ncbi:uncharacterized protein LOC111860735 [Arapaima gigas]